MSELPSDESTTPVEAQEENLNSRRLFLGSMGKWSGAAIIAAVGGISVGSAPDARAGAWINRRGGWVNRGGSWINRRGGGGGWVNRRGGRGGSWINRR